MFYRNNRQIEAVPWEIHGDHSLVGRDASGSLCDAKVRLGPKPQTKSRWVMLEKTEESILRNKTMSMLIISCLAPTPG